MEKQREINSEYLIGFLLFTSHIDARLMDRSSMLYQRFKKHIINAVIGPMSIMRECTAKQIFADPAGRQIAADLINEAYNVAKYHLRWLERHRVFKEWFKQYLEGPDERPDRYHQMLLDGLEGKETDVDVVSGWLIEHGGKLGSLVTHMQRY
jgi:ketopantoate reductase